MTWPVDASPKWRWSQAAERVARLKPGDLFDLLWINRIRTAYVLRREGDNIWFHLVGEKCKNRLAERAFIRRHFEAMERKRDKARKAA